jgi:non-ribosomal peptide synthetase component F
VYVTLLAILKTGAAYVPIDPEYPSDRVSYILNDAKSPVVVTSSKLPLFRDAGDSMAAKVAALQPFEGKVFFLDLPENEAALAKCSAKSVTLATPCLDSDRAYIIYTSGSTGRPKGVAIEHRSVCAFVRAERKMFNLPPTEVVYQGFSIAFDASVEEVWLAFASGSALFCATPDILHAGPELASIWIKHRVSVVSTVPTLLTMLEEDVPCLKLLILGGEACHKDLILKWARPGRRMVNSYGPTEATVICTYIDCDASAPYVTIGRAVPNYFLYVIDPVTMVRLITLSLVSG